MLAHPPSSPRSSGAAALRWYSVAMTPGRAAALFASRDDVALGARVLEVVAKAQAAHPATEAGSAGFIERLGSLCEGDPARLSRLACDDLWLAHAAASGCPRAVAAFEQEVFRPRVEAIARRYPDDPTVEDEAQDLRLRLVADAEPRLLAYRGQGTLAGWVSVSLARAVVKARRRRDRDDGRQP